MSDKPPFQCRDFNEITRAVAAIPDGRRYSAKEAVRSEIKRRGRALSNADRAVAEVLLCQIDWPRGYAWPGAGAIARETGFSRRHVIRSRGKLAALSLIVTAQATSDRGDAEVRVTFPGLLGVPEGDVGPGNALWSKALTTVQDLEEEKAFWLGEGRRFSLGQRVRKIKEASWQGKIVGVYSTELTPVGYAVESEREPGSVQIYPEVALEEVR